MKVELQLTEEVIKQITEDATKQIAEDMSKFMSDKSLHGFYDNLSKTIEANGVEVLGSGLTEKIMTERGLLDEFLSKMD